MAPTPEVKTEAAAVETSATKKYKDGEKLLVHAVIANQVNDLTAQRIPRDGHTVVLYDSWIGAQLRAGVLVEVAL